MTVAISGPGAQPTPPDPGNTRIIRGIVVPVRHVMLPHSQLSFFVDNPRVHSTLRRGGGEPSQAEIERHLIGLDHVKKLAKNIESEGGLHDPVIVRGGTNDVLEGNCRLAAYRLLGAGKDGARWATMRCEVVPSDIDDDLVFSLLAQYHINGKLEWQPFEQAGFFWREYLNDNTKGGHKAKIDALAARGGGIGKKEADHLVSTYGFMMDHDDVDPEHWSHYDEYFTSRTIAKARQDHPDLDERFVEIVPSILAEDVRKLAKVCTQQRPLKKFLARTASLEDAYGLYLDSGADSDAYLKFHRFREWLARPGVTDQIALYGGQDRQKVLLEVKKLDVLISRLHRSLVKEEGPTKRRR